jgi:hypothetical protein
MAAILAIARFCERSSELHIEEKWNRSTALEGLLGVPPEKVHSDRLLPHKEAIESHLKQRFGELFELKCDLLLYDVTSTYVEGDIRTAVRMRHMTEPEAEQKTLLQRLGLQLPSRLKRIDRPTQM